MLFAGVGVTLFVIGSIVGWVGLKLGTALSVLTALVWFVVLVNINSESELSSAESSDLSVGTLIGMFAFLFASNIAERASARWKRQPGVSETD